MIDACKPDLSRFIMVFFMLLLVGSNPAVAGETRKTPHLRFFGFTLVDVGHDDPLDQVAKTNYLDEVAGFTNTADILVVKPENIVSRMEAMKSLAVKPYVHVYPLFFEQTGSDGPSGSKYTLRKDYREQWSLFISRNSLKTRQKDLAAFYLGEEPTWNGISAGDLRAASDLIKATVPRVPILIVEAYPSIAELEVPKSADWVGFDRYFVRNPAKDPTYLKEFALLKSKLSSPRQKLVVVMDAHYRPDAHGAFGLSASDMTDVALSYFDLAKSDPKVVALFAYMWPGGFDGPETMGARQLSRKTRRAYELIGKAITAK